MTFLQSIGIILLAVVLLALSFIIGLFLLIRGFLKRYLAEYAGTNTPRNFMITGTVMISLPLLAVAGLAVWGISSSVGTIYARSHYECVPDVWRHESVTESRAEEEIIKALLISADKGNRAAFCRNFTPELQDQNGFDAAVNQFLAAVPVGLSECQRSDRMKDDADSLAQESSVRTDSLSFRCDLNGTPYFLYLEYCYRNTSEPDKVGVTRFLVMNLEAAAVYERGGRELPDNTYLLCDIKSSHEVNARLIGGRPYVWTPTDVPLLKEDELRALLRDTRRLDDPALQTRLGEANIGIKHDDSTEYGYFYQLVNEDGEPRYAYFQTDSEYGAILYALLCTPYEVDNGNPLYLSEAYN